MVIILICLIVCFNLCLSIVCVKGCIMFLLFILKVIVLILSGVLVSDIMCVSWLVLRINICICYFLVGFGLFNIDWVCLVWKVFILFIIFGLWMLMICVVSNFVLVVLVLLMVSVFIVMFFGICIMEYNELSLDRVWDWMGMFNIGKLVNVVVILGRCVVLFVLVMIICKLCFLVLEV